MALDISELNTVSKKYYDQTLTQQVYEKDPFYGKVLQKKNVTWSGGTQIQWPIRYKKLGTAQWFGPRDQIAYTGAETRTAAVESWRYLNAVTTLHMDEKIKNGGKGQVVDLVKDKTEELQEDMLDKFCTEIYATTASTNALTPLVTIVDSATTYAGIAVADAADWASQEDGTTTELTIYGQYSLSYYINACTFGPNGPRYHITTKNLLAKLESLIEPQKRYEDKETADIGFRNLTFHGGNTVVATSYCPAGYWYGLDIDKFEIRYHPDYNFKTSDWFELPQAGYPWSAAKTVVWAGNTLCRMRKSSFKMTALDYTI
jgi:hypothetical protein